MNVKKIKPYITCNELQCNVVISVLRTGGCIVYPLVDLEHSPARLPRSPTRFPRVLDPESPPEPVGPNEAETIHVCYVYGVAQKLNKTLKTG